MFFDEVELKALQERLDKGWVIRRDTMQKLIMCAYAYRELFARQNEAKPQATDALGAYFGRYAGSP